MRPSSPWDDVAQVLNQDGGQKWSVERLRRAARGAARKRMANPDMSQQPIGTQFEQLREHTPRGEPKWSASSVKHPLDQTAKLGLAPDTTLGR